METATIEKGYCKNCIHFDNQEMPCQWNYEWDDEDDWFDCCDWVRKQKEEPTNAVRTKTE